MAEQGAPNDKAGKAGPVRLRDALRKARIEAADRPDKKTALPETGTGPLNRAGDEPRPGVGQAVPRCGSSTMEKRTPAR